MTAAAAACGPRARGKGAEGAAPGRQHRRSDAGAAVLHPPRIRHGHAAGRPHHPRGRALRQRERAPASRPTSTSPCARWRMTLCVSPCGAASPGSTPSPAAASVGPSRTRHRPSAARSSTTSRGRPGLPPALANGTAFFSDFRDLVATAFWSSQRRRAGSSVSGQRGRAGVVRVPRRGAPEARRELSAGADGMSGRRLGIGIIGSGFNARLPSAGVHRGARRRGAGCLEPQCPQCRGRRVASAAARRRRGHAPFARSPTWSRTPGSTLSGSAAPTTPGSRTWRRSPTPSSAGGASFVGWPARSRWPAMSPRRSGCCGS